MAVKLRLKRMGAKKRSFYRIVAADARSPRDGRFIETVGTYNPITNPTEVKIDEEKALYWLGHGAIPTDTVRSLLSKAGVIKKFNETKTPKTKVKKEKTVKKVVKVQEKVVTEKKPVKAVKEPAKAEKKPVKKTTKVTKKEGQK